ncbi:MAG: HD domain-containing protein [Deltaproteobacteria bacterium]|jgi:HD-GYP domain-containing protein (c-di-GMP phosphodiesterase class II)|nr:HD domain-containing protein [Deltaproteobacteria bacterium]
MSRIFFWGQFLEKMSLENMAKNHVDRLNEVGRMVSNFNSVFDLARLMEKILTSARTLTKCEAGTIYLLRGGKLVFAQSQNDYLDRIVDDPTGLPFFNRNMEVSRSTLSGYVALERKPLTINDTSSIHPGAPYQHFTGFDNESSYVCQAIMTLPLATDDNEPLGVLQLINPLGEDGLLTCFSEDDERILSFYCGFAAQAMEKSMTMNSAISHNVEIISSQDPLETRAHATRVATLATAIYRHWSSKRGVNEDKRLRVLNLLPFAAMLHDVGKIYVPKSVLTKPGRLDQRERAIMEGHVLAGARMYVDSFTPLDEITREVILDHHERWDGQGYPGWVDVATGAPLPEKSGPDGRIMGKKGEEISLYGRIVAVADVYDALSNRRAYKEAFDQTLAIQIMEQESGRHFDPEVVESFLAVKSILNRIKNLYPDPPYEPPKPVFESGQAD